MFANYTTDDPRHAKPLCDALRGLRRDNPEQEADEVLRADGWNTQHEVFHPKDGQYPAFYISQSSLGMVILIDGTDNLASAMSQAADYIDGVLTSGLNPRLLRTEAAAGFVAGVSRQAPFTVPQRVYMAGWSYGATIATYLYFHFRNLGIDPIDIHLVSFGAPRSAGPQFQTALSAWSTHARIFRSNDPIPLVPPRVTEAPGLTVTVGPFIAARFSLIGHANMGIELTDDGGMVPQAQPRQAVANVAGSLGAWIESWVNGEANAHSLSGYSSRLGLAIARQNPPLPVPPIAPEPVFVAPMQEVRVAEREAAVNLRRQANVQNATVPTIPNELGFSTHRAGRGIWRVLFGETIVATHTNRKGARAIARAGNVMLRQALHAAVFDQAGFTAELMAFFGKAKAGSDGIKPALNDVFPGNVP